MERIRGRWRGYETEGVGGRGGETERVGDGVERIGGRGGDGRMETIGGRKGEDIRWGWRG